MRGPRPRPVWERVLDKVLVPADFRRDCWLWQGGCNRARWGTKRPIVQVGTSRFPKVALVARLMCTWWHGEPPDGAEAGHTCPAGENAMCVNPWHLTWQTRLENERYKQARRRAAA